MNSSSSYRRSHDRAPPWFKNRIKSQTSTLSVYSCPFPFTRWSRTFARWPRPFTRRPRAFAQPHADGGARRLRSRTRSWSRSQAWYRHGGDRQSDRYYRRGPFQRSYILDDAVERRKRNQPVALSAQLGDRSLGSSKFQASRVLYSKRFSATKISREKLEDLETATVPLLRGLFSCIF